MSHPGRKPSPILFVCFAFVLFSSNNLHGQNDQLKFEVLTTENGLNSNVIYNIIQDRKGYLWIATNEGINRYDGYEFTAYRHITGNTATIQGNQIYGLYEDEDGNIWAGTDGGLAKYNSSANNFERINTAGKVGTGQMMHLDNDEIMMLGGGNIFLFNRHTLATKELIDSTIHSPYGFVAVNFARDTKGTIFLGGYRAGYPDENLILKYNFHKKIFQPFLQLPFMKGNGKQPEIISYLFIDSHNTFWIGSSPGKIYQCSLDNSMNIFNPVLVKKDVQYLVHIFEDRDGKIWLAGSTGVLRFDHNTGGFINITDQSARKIFQDKTGVIWIGSYNGLYKLNTPRNKFRHLTSKPGSSLPLLSDFVLGVREIEGKKILVNYHWGEKRFSLFDPASQTMLHYAREDFRLEEFIKRFKIKNYRYLNEDTFRRVTTDIKNQLNNYNEIFLIADNRHSLWFAHTPNFSLAAPLNYSTHLLTNYFSDVQIYNDEFWFSTNGLGLWSFNSASYKTNKYLASVQKNSISSNHLNCLLIENNGNIWVGTKGTGLDYFDRTKNSFLNYTTRDGLSNNSIFSLLFDDKGRLWIGTGNGLSCLDTATKIFINFDRSDGLNNAEFNRNSACKLPDGYLMMGGMNGIDYFHPDSVMSTFIKPNVQITDFKVYNKSIFPNANISLAHNDNYVTIEFAAMDFRNPAANKFAYMLKGIDKDWVIAGNQRSVSYATLSPGRYHFIVKAAGRDGVWNDLPAEIYFGILTPWWKSWWFLSITGFFIISILYAIYRFRIQQLKKVFAVRTRISQDLHDEVGATLTSISFLSEIVKKQTGNGVSPAKESIEKIGEFSRDMIGEMNDIVWAINPANDKFEKIENRMQNFASPFLAAKNIEFNFKSDGQIRNISLGMQQRKNLYLIFKEAVNNSAKYSECNEVNVAIFRENNHIQMEIADDGKGFSFGQENGNVGGNGLKNMKERAAEINAQFLIQTIPGQGTKISVSIPITQNAY